MKRTAMLFVCCLTLLMQGCGHDADHGNDHMSKAAHESHDDHAAHTAPALPPGQRWPTDQPLRASMLNIRNAVAATADDYQQSQLTPVAAQELAGVVETNVQYMIANCKLAPDPDAALHVLIGRMMSAAAALRKNPAATEGWPQLRAVLSDYESTFDDAGFGSAGVDGAGATR